MRLMLSTMLRTAAYSCLLLCALAVAGTARAADEVPRQILPVTLVPAHYDLSIVPDAQALTYTGVVEITGNAPNAGRRIVLNAKGLVFDEVRLDGVPGATVSMDDTLQRATLVFPAAYAPGHHVLRIAYHGRISRDSTVGFFAMDYDTPQGRRRTLATNLEPVEARLVFPCWDEPGLKATFAVSVDAPSDRMAISNMPVAARESLAPGIERIHFASSPRMSTYLFFLSIGDYERIHRNVDGVDLGVVFKRGDTVKAGYALDQAARLLHYYDGYFGVRFPLPKLDLVAAPGEITGGSMENWGAIFFSQDHVLFDPAASTEHDRQLVFVVMAHEMSHQWFGDLVTMNWWDNLWLNEGFARWMQTAATDVLHPEWKMGLQAASIFESGKRADARRSSHPVLQPVVSAEQAIQAFDNITYDKGAAVITMLAAYVGPDRFRDGVRRYMAAHAYGNSTDADLWSQIAAVSGKPVLDIEHDFTRQTGVPLIRVEPAGEGSRLVLGRFAENPGDIAGMALPVWRIPLRVVTQGQSRELILQGSAQVAGTAPLVNAGGTAYARVAYPAPVAQALARRIATLAAADQIDLINDAWALGQSGYAPASNLMVFVAHLPTGADPVVWSRAIELLATVDRAYGGASGQVPFRRAARAILAPLALQLGDGVAGEPSNVTTLRAQVWAAQSRFGDAAALERARGVYTSGKGSIAEQRAALEIVGAAADAATFDALLARVRRTTDPQRKAQLLLAMAGARDPALSRRMVDIALGPEVPAGSAAQLLRGAGNENPDAVWEALRPRLAKGPLPMDPMVRWVTLTNIAGASAAAARIAEVRQYGEQDMPPGARRPIEAAVESIQLNQRVRSVALPDITAWAQGQAH